MISFAIEKPESGATILVAEKPALSRVARSVSRYGMLRVG